RLYDHGDPGRGFWIQPAGTTLQSGYATPIVLEPRGDSWTGEVRPLRDRIRFYLVIERGPQGRTAWVRETELNVGQHIGPLAVAGTMEALVFRTADGGIAFTGRLTGDRLALHIDDVALDLALTRRDRAGAPGFYPRDPGRYTYRIPSPGPDGWPVAS